MDYFWGALLGLGLGLIAVFFAHGGIAGRRLFVRLLGKKGGWRRNFLWMPCFSAGVGIYGVWLFGGLGRPCAALMLLGCCLLTAAVTDMRGRYIPGDALAFFAAVFLLFRASALSGGELTSALLGAAAGGALLGLPRLVRPASVGLGDVKLLAVCGLMAGFPGVVYLLARALLALALFCVVQLLRKKVALSQEIAFAPFLLFGALI